MSEPVFNPRTLKPAIIKVRPMYRPKYYTANLEGQGNFHRSAKRFKRFSDALDYAEKVRSLMIVRYDRRVARLVAMGVK